MVRRHFLFAAVVWISGALYVWPAGTPVGLVLLESESEARAVSISDFDREGRMVVTGVLGQQPFRRIGPVALHDPKTGERISTLYSGDERIEELDVERGFAVTRTDRAVRLVSLENRILIEHPGQFSGAGFPALLSPGGTRFLAHDGLKLTAYDVATTKAFWSRDDVYRAAWAEDDALHLWLEGRSERPSDSVTEFVRINLVTGATTPGNRKAFAKAHEGRLSPDGRLVWWIGSGSQSDDPTGLYDLESNRLLWGMEAVQQNGMGPVRMRHLEFSSDSSELQYFYHVMDHRRGLARWRASDGECLAPLPADAMASTMSGSMAMPPDGSWAAYSKSEARTRFAPIPAIVWQAPAWLSTSIADYLAATTYAVQVCDNINNRLLASIPRQAFRLSADPDGSGLFLHGGRQITRYEVPPKMAYGAILLRIALPAAGIILLGELFRVQRMRRRRLDEAPAPELAA